MSTPEQSVTLLRKNKREQAAAFNAVGLKHVTENSRASEFGKYIKWAGGLLDICLAVQRYDDGTYHYFTREEWESLKANKDKFIKRGIRVRAYGHSFILAATDCVSAEGGMTLAWGNRVNVSELDNRSLGAAYNDFAGAANTEYIIAQLAGTTGSQNVEGAPAAEAARAYKAYTKEFDGIEDTSDWHLPGLGVLITIYRCKEQVQEALEYFWSAECKLSSNDNTHYYWSSTEFDASSVFTFSNHWGSIFVQNKDSLFLVRAVCEEV